MAGGDVISLRQFVLVVEGDGLDGIALDGNGEHAIRPRVTREVVVQLDSTTLFDEQASQLKHVEKFLRGRRTRSVPLGIWMNRPPKLKQRLTDGGQQPEIVCAQRSIDVTINLSWLVRRPAHR